ncbi:hypothetical protein O3P69_020022 [Scylla paramamosain]|uniref:Uncharacterized protein n=1 Tax=Scylla paramamosain TaxID=85552 RepID=A0AAW0TK93_SCYPA
MTSRLSAIKKVAARINKRNSTGQQTFQLRACHSLARLSATRRRRPLSQVGGKGEGLVLCDNAADASSSSFPHPSQASSPLSLPSSPPQDNSRSREAAGGTTTTTTTITTIPTTNNNKNTTTTTAVNPAAASSSPYQRPSSGLAARPC